MLTLKAGGIPEMPLREGRLTHVDRNSTCDIWFGTQENPPTEDISCSYSPR